MSKTREESANNIMNELVPTLECIFGTMGGCFDNIQKIINKSVKDENIIGLHIHGDDNNNVNIPIIIRSNYNETIDSLKDAFIDGGGFKKYNRKIIENFSNVKQMVTSAIVRDDEHILLLSNLKPNAFYQRATLSFIQGHVEYPNNTESITLLEAFNNNMKKELNEELGNRDQLFNGFNIGSPIGIIYLPVAPSTNKHCCILYEVVVDDVDMFYSNELDKHSLVKLRIDQIHTQYNYLCPWVLQGLRFSVHIRDMYLQYTRNLNIPDY